MSPNEFKEARRKLGLTQAELAYLLGYRGVMSISKIERGLSPLPDQSAGGRLLKAYLDGYRSNDWPESK
jgi:transcriptional regulator with XRE-family HTH domain